MEFRRIEYFLVLAEKLNFTKAAQELCISTPALTKQIRLLEEELGLTLFDRSTHSVTLTEDGVMCQNQFSSVKAHYDEALRTIREAGSSRQKVIRIGFFAPLPKAGLINPIIHMLASEFPDLEFRFSTNTMDGLREQVKNRETDLVLTNAHEYEDWIGCERIIFKTVPAQIVVSDKHPWARDGKKILTEKDLAESEILLMIKHGPYEFNSFYGRVQTRLRTYVQDFDTLLIELEKGKGFAVFPKAFNDMEYSRFVFFDLPEKLAFRFHTMCSCSSSNKNPDVRKVFSCIRKHKADFSF